MKAMLFAAGLGTRLRPLTDLLPKALVPLQGKPLLEWNILRLKKFGVTEIVVNVHHFADKIDRFLEEKEFFGMDIRISDEREHLLETGGGLKKAAPFFDDGHPFFVCNADVICDLDLGKLADEHFRHQPIATLAVMERESARNLIFDLGMNLCGWQNTKTGEIKLPRKGGSQHFAFSGIQVLSPGIFPLMKREGVFSLIDVYLDLSANEKLRGYVHGGLFLDLGTPEKLASAEKMNFSGFLD